MTAPIGPALGDIIGRGIGTAKKEIPGMIPGADSANAVIDGVIATRRWIADRHNWVRVVWFVSGMFLMMGGAMIISRPAISGAASTAATVVKAIPGKRGIAKAVKS